MKDKKDLEFAKKLAKKHHEGQFRKDGRPHVSHPLAVSENVNSETEKLVAVLHDILEDTELTKKDLEKHFPEEVVKAVELLTKKNGQNYSEYLENIKTNENARKVKIEDMKHNLSDNSTEKQIKKYTKALKNLGGE